VTQSEPGARPGHCPLCGGGGGETHLPLPEYRYRTCRSCRLYYLDPVPAPASLVRLYADPRYFCGAGGGYDDYDADAEAAIPEYDRRLAYLATHVTGRRLLDVGCAHGQFALRARQAGWQVDAIETSPSARRRAERLLASRVSATVRGLPAKARYDAVTAWEVVEHVTDPIGFVASLATRLRPGGVVAVSTPNGGHRDARLHPDRFPEFQAPLHLFLFTAPSLASLLARAGLLPASVQFTSPEAPMPEALWHAVQRVRGIPLLGSAVGAVRRAVWLSASATRSFVQRRESYCLGLEAVARRTGGA